MLGFMVLTAFMSMWISNAATTAMMVPILEAVLNELGLSLAERRMMMLRLEFEKKSGFFLLFLESLVFAIPPILVVQEPLLELHQI